MKTAWLAIIVLFCLPSSTMAESIRCGSQIISRGSTSSEVAALCGDPAQVDRSTIYRGNGGSVTGRPAVVAGSSDEIKVEIWTYNFGPDKLMERIRFEDGIVADIQSLGYGYNDP